MTNRILRSEAFRQAAVHAAILALAMAALISVVFLIFDRSLKDNLLREVDDDLAAIRTAYVTPDPDGGAQEAKEIVADRMLAPGSSDVFLLQHNGTREAGNLPAMATRPGVITFRLRDRRSSGFIEVTGRGAVMPGGDYAFVGRDLGVIRNTEREALYAFTLLLAGSLLLALLSGLLISRRFLARINAVTGTCRAIIMGKLDERIPQTGGSGEFDRLGEAVNAMLDRIQDLMESLKQVSTDIAHDLRTPLTRLRHTLERARNDRGGSGTIDGAIAECDTLLATFAALLRIAQIEAGARRAEFRTLDLAALVGRARDIYAPVIEDASHLLRVRVEPAAPVQGDPQLLLQAISNLLDNAIAHTPPGTQITLSLGTEQGRPVLAVGDNGAGIPAAERRKVLRRFYRCEQSRSTPGSGLGLALVAAVAELHQARLAIGDNAPGLNVALTFPAARI